MSVRALSLISQDGKFMEIMPPGGTRLPGEMALATMLGKISFLCQRPSLGVALKSVGALSLVLRRSDHSKALMRCSGLRRRFGGKLFLLLSVSSLLW